MRGLTKNDNVSTYGHFSDQSIAKPVGLVVDWVRDKALATVRKTDKSVKPPAA